MLDRIREYVIVKIKVGGDSYEGGGLLVGIDIKTNKLILKILEGDHIKELSWNWQIHNNEQHPKTWVVEEDLINRDVNTRYRLIQEDEIVAMIGKFPYETLISYNTLSNYLRAKIALTHEQNTNSLT